MCVCVQCLTQSDGSYGSYTSQWHSLPNCTARMSASDVYSGVKLNQSRHLHQWSSASSAGSAGSTGIRVPAHQTRLQHSHDWQRIISSLSLLRVYTSHLSWLALSLFLSHCLILSVSWVSFALSFSKYFLTSMITIECQPIFHSLLRGCITETSESCESCLELIPASERLLSGRHFPVDCLPSD